MELSAIEYDRLEPADGEHFEDCASIRYSWCPCDCEDLRDDYADVAAEIRADYAKENY